VGKKLKRADQSPMLSCLPVGIVILSCVFRLSSNPLSFKVYERNRINPFIIELIRDLSTIPQKLGLELLRDTLSAAVVITAGSS
jgi:hypothetical protein